MFIVFLSAGVCCIICKVKIPFHHIPILSTHTERCRADMFDFTEECEGNYLADFMRL